jgi:hypothetical protein
VVLLDPLPLSGYKYIDAKERKETLRGWAPVANACNPSYVGGRDQEDHG